MCNKLSPRGRRDDMPPTMAVRLVADLRLSAGGSAIRTWLYKPQAASVPIAYGSCAPGAAAPRDRQTDGSRYLLMQPTAGAA